VHAFFSQKVIWSSRSFWGSKSKFSVEARSQLHV